MTTNMPRPWRCGWHTQISEGAFGVLCAREIFDAALHAGAIRFLEREQAHDGPRGLRRGARTATFENRIVVSVAAFAPAAVAMLHAFEPVARFEEPRLVHVEAH